MRRVAVPLERIPDTFVGDPTEGLLAVMQWFPEGSRYTFRIHYDAVHQRDSYVYEIYTPGSDLPTFVVPYEPPPGMPARIMTQYEYDQLKSESIRRWLYKLTECAAVWNQTSLPALRDLTKANTISAALTGARAKPEPKVRTVGAPEDAFVARVLARRKA